jgi:hypothetical protein
LARHWPAAQRFVDLDVRARLLAHGLTPRGTTADEPGAATRAQLAKYGALIRQSGITLE